MQSPEEVVVRWERTWNASDPDGGRGGLRRGIITFVLQRFSAGWITVAAQNTDIVPNVETRLNTDGEQLTVHYR